MAQQIVASDGRLWTLPEFITSPADAAERDRLLAQRYFLVRQGSLGEIFRCGLCRGKHEYLTLRCVERPFSGVAEGLWGFFQVAGTPQALTRMRPDERAIVTRLTRIFGPSTPDLTTSHPEMARSLGVADRDILRGTVPLGILEEIPAALAQRYQDRINLSLPIDARLRLPGLTD